MQIRLTTRAGDRYLCPLEVVRRLEREFAYVETSQEDGRRHVLEVIQQLLALKHAGYGPVDDAYLAKLDQAEEKAICVHFGDDLNSEEALLSTPIVPEESLFFEYSSRNHQDGTRSLVARCAAALGYKIVEEGQLCI